MLNIIKSHFVYNVSLAGMFVGALVALVIMLFAGRASVGPALQDKRTHILLLPFYILGVIAAIPATLIDCLLCRKIRKPIGSK